jgi:hypothetical protein
MTEFAFVPEGSGLKVKAMKYPLIFGLSDAGNVATGVIQGSSDEPTITVDGQGNVEVKPFFQAVDQLNGEDDIGGAGIPAPTNFRVVGGTKHHYVQFAFDTVLTMVPLGYEFVIEEAYKANGPWEEVHAAHRKHIRRSSLQQMQSKGALSLLQSFLKMRARQANPAMCYQGLYLKKL